MTYTSAWAGHLMTALSKGRTHKSSYNINLNGMKTHRSFIAMLLAASQLSFATIRNGYTDIDGARTSLKSITTLLEDSRQLSFAERQSMKTKRDMLLDYIHWHEITEQLLSQFRLISPDLYTTIDKLMDRRGRNVDVYVRFVPDGLLSPGVAGESNIEQDKNDPHLYRSEYGPGTVSVVIQSGRKSLLILAHEFGHVKYQVENLAEYFDYYKKHYRPKQSEAKSLGHHDNDQSGRQAIIFVNGFLSHYVKFQKATKHSPESSASMTDTN